MAAMAEAAAPAVSVRSSSVASEPLTRTRSSPRPASSRKSICGIEGAADQGRRVGQVEVGPAGGDADRPVQRAGIEVMPAQALGDEAADGALAGAGGAVDGQDGNAVCGSLRCSCRHYARAGPIRLLRRQLPAVELLLRNRLIGEGNTR